jgi:hypothetical protein
MLFINRISAQYCLYGQVKQTDQINSAHKQHIQTAPKTVLKTVLKTVTKNGYLTGKPPLKLQLNLPPFRTALSIS